LTLFVFRVEKVQNPDFLSSVKLEDGTQIKLPDVRVLEKKRFNFLLFLLLLLLALLLTASKIEMKLLPSTSKSSSEELAENIVEISTTTESLVKATLLSLTLLLAMLL